MSSTSRRPEAMFDREVPTPHAICRVLEDAGVDTILGIPGGNVVKIFDALYDFPALRTMLVREESLAGIMAEVYGRVLGKPAIVIAQGAWVLANAAMGMLEALTGSAPLVVMADLSDKVPHSHHNPTQCGTGDYGNWDARQSFQGFAKVVLEAHHPAQAVQMTQLAIKHATSGTPGPVVVLYYSASLTGTVGPDTRPRLFCSAGYLHQQPQEANAETVRSAAAALRAGERPVILVGNGARVSGASDAIVELATALDAPVVTTGSGKGVFPENHPLAAGVIGDYGLRAASALLGDSDVVLAVGTRLAPGDTLQLDDQVLDPTRQTIIQIDAEPLRAGHSVPIDVALVGDAATVVRQLLAHLDSPGTDAAPRRGPERVRNAFAEFDGFDVDESRSDAVPILPQRVVHELGSALPVDAVITADAGENRIFLVHHLRTREAGGFVQPGSMGGMGFAIPAALGHRLAVPHRPVVAVCGDGGFAMSMNGLMTSLELDLSIVVVVLNNACLAWVKHVQGDRPIASDLRAYDHAAIARAMGCDGIRIEKPQDLAPTLADAIASGRTTVIDVITSADETWEQVTHPRSSLRAKR